MAKKGKVIAASKPTATDIATVKALFVEGHATADLMRLISDTLPLVDPTQVLQAVGDEFLRDSNVDKDAMRGFAMNAYREIYRRALEANDFAAATRAVKLWMEL